MSIEVKEREVGTITFHEEVCVCLGVGGVAMVSDSCMYS